MTREATSVGGAAYTRKRVGHPAFARGIGEPDRRLWHAKRPAGEARRVREPAASHRVSAVRKEWPMQSAGPLLFKPRASGGRNADSLAADVEQLATVFDALEPAAAVIGRVLFDLTRTASDSSKQLAEFVDKIEPAAVIDRH